MIVVRVEHGKCIISASGHAGYAEPGKDIVCSAVSTLMYTLATEGIGNSIERGEMRIVPPVTGITDEYRAQFRMITRGLQLVQKKYPAYVMLEERK